MPSAGVNAEWYRSPIVQSLLSLNHVVVVVVNDLVVLIGNDSDAFRGTGACRRPAPCRHADGLGTPSVLQSESNRFRPTSQPRGLLNSDPAYIPASPGS